MTGLPVTDATDSAAPPRASPSSLESHDAGEVDALVEGHSRVDGILADHRVDHEEDFVGDDGPADLAGLVHHFRVDAESAGGVHDHDVVQGALGFLDAGTGDGDRVPGRVVQLGGGGARVRGEDGDAGALATTCSCVTALGRCRSQATSMGLWPCALRLAGELAGEGGLTGALEAGEHDDGGPVLAAGCGGFAAEDLDEFLVDDLHDLLARVQRAGDLGAERTLAYAGGELRTTGDGNVGVQQARRISRTVASTSASVRPALATEVLEGCCQPVRE